MSARLKVKRGKTESWADSTKNGLEPGQIGVEYLTDGNMRLKVGKNTADGSATAWTGLPYATPKLSLYTDDDGVYFNNGTHALWQSSGIVLGDGVNDIWINGDTGVRLTGGTFNVECPLKFITSDGIYFKNTILSSDTTHSLFIDDTNNILNLGDGGTDITLGADLKITLSAPEVECIGNIYSFQTATSSLGNSSYKWATGYITSLYTQSLLPSDGGSDISVGSNFCPNSISTSETSGYTLGSSSHKWRCLYAYSGTIQTSDRSAKDSIHYITESNNSSVMKAATMSLRSSSLESTSDSSDTSQVTIEDVIDFVSNLNPATFCYKNGQGENIEATEENSNPEDIQLGLIADDIKDHKLFKYVGVETTYEEEVTPAVKDEEGNVVTEAVTETKTTLGLQAIPLATAALTACKYLIQKNEEIESRLSAIEEQLAALLSTDGN